MSSQQGHQGLSSIGRGSGRSSTAAVAYRAGIEVIDERTGEVFDYTKKSGVEHQQMVLPQSISDLPEWMKDTKKFWNENEKSHTRGKSIVAREYVVDLPHELSLETRTSMVKEFAQKISDQYKIGIHVALHKPGKDGDQRNFHAHLLLGTKSINERGFGNVNRDLDPINCQRKPDQKNTAEVFRSEWAEICNRELKHAGVDKVYEHESLKVQKQKAIDAKDFDKAEKLNREPTIHLGVAATAMERKGIQTDKAQVNKSIRLENGIQRLERTLISLLSQTRKAISEYIKPLRVGLNPFTRFSTTIEHERPDSNSMVPSGKTANNQKSESGNGQVLNTTQGAAMEDKKQNQDQVAQQKQQQEAQIREKLAAGIKARQAKVQAEAKAKVEKKRKAEEQISANRLLNQAAASEQQEKEKKKDRSR